jgi:hypothetical protein
MRAGGCTSSRRSHVTLTCVSVCAQPCFLYKNVKGPEQDLFTAAAALFQLTGDAGFRADADAWWDAVGPKDSAFYLNWNNVVPLGVVALASAGAPAAAAHNRAFYIAQLKNIVDRWSTCSNEGKTDTICKCATHGLACYLQAPAMLRCQLAALC